MNSCASFGLLTAKATLAQNYNLQNCPRSCKGHSPIKFDVANIAPAYHCGFAGNSRKLTA